MIKIEQRASKAKRLKPMLKESCLLMLLLKKFVLVPDFDALGALFIFITLLCINLHFFIIINDILEIFTCQINYL